MDIPILVKVSLEGISDAGQVDTEVYCVNLTQQPFQISARSTSFTTVDEEAGTVIEHGSGPAWVILLPGEAKMVGDVAGWEWDGYVGMELRLREVGSTTGLRASFDLKRGAGDFTMKALGKRGQVIPPSHTNQI
jgi:hypothetical protein